MSENNDEPSGQEDAGASQGSRASRPKPKAKAQNFPRATEFTAFAQDVQLGEVVKLWGLPARYEHLGPTRDGEKQCFRATTFPGSPVFCVAPRTFVERDEPQVEVLTAPTSEPRELSGKPRKRKRKPRAKT